MKVFFKYILFLILFTVFILLGLGGFVYYKYFKIYTFYLNNNKCFSDLNKKLDIYQYIKNQSLSANVGQKYVDFKIPYDYILSSLLHEINSFKYVQVGIPLYAVKVLNGLNVFYEKIFLLFKILQASPQNPVVCIYVTGKNSAKVFIAKNWWAFLDIDIRLSNNKIKITDLTIDSFSSSLDLVNLLNSKLAQDVNIIPSGINVYLDKDGLALKYKIQNLIIKTH